MGAGLIRGLLLVVLAGGLAASTPASPQEAPTSAAASGAASERPEVLITRDGQRIATRGRWRIESSRIVYTDERGVLSSVRREEIDLEATRRAARSAASSPAPVAEGERRPVLVLEDGDVARFRPTAASEGAGAGSQERADGDGSEGGASATEPATPPTVQERRSEALEIVSYRDLGDPATGVRLYGTLKNAGTYPVGQLYLRARVFDERGEPLLEREVRVAREPLAAGASLNFRLAIPEIRAYGSLELSVSSRDIPAGSTDG